MNALWCESQPRDGRAQYAWVPLVAAWALTFVAAPLLLFAYRRQSNLVPTGDRLR